MGTLLLTACEGKITAELFIRDILEIGRDSKASFFTTATVEIESLDSDSMEKMKEKIKEWFREPQNFREMSKDYSTFLVADIKVPVSHISKKSQGKKRDLFSLIVKDLSLIHI